MVTDRQAFEPPVVSPADLCPLLELLHARQRRHGYIAEQDIAELAPIARTSPTELYGTITAYPRFKLEPSSSPAVCNGPACRQNGALALADQLDSDEFAACLGLCDQPVAVLTEHGPRIAPATGHSNLSEPTNPIVAFDPATSAFFGADDALAAVRTALGSPPDDIVARIVASGLRGCGGAGFPTGRKWQAVQAAEGDTKYVVCNADESEPGTFKDRQILDHQPQRLLAGIIIAAHAVGATAGIIYLRFEYQRQFERLTDAINRCRDAGLLGHRFDVVVRRGAGAYVCGEESALLNSLEGKRPIPRDRPPYPTTAGLFGAPTLVQNVETLAAVPAIINRGAPWYRDAGQPKLYCLSGDVPRPGVFELPMTVTARQLLERGGVDTALVRAFTLGGLSGGLLPPSALDVRLDFESAREHGAHLGSGAVIVLGRSRCLVRFLVGAMEFFADESCGKCFPCRIGVTRLHERMQALSMLQAVDESELRELVSVLETGSACGLGSAAGLVASDLLDGFDDELRAHCDGICPAGECTSEAVS